jgi:DNA-binding transcriptional LysR family regulator
LPWITYEEGSNHLPQARWLAAAAEASATAPILVNDAEAILQAVRAGLGKSLLPCFVGEGEKELKRIGETKPVLSREIWLLVHPELRPQARIAAAMTWLNGLMATCRAPA